MDKIDIIRNSLIKSYCLLVKGSKDGYINIGHVANLAADIMGNRKHSLELIKVFLESEHSRSDFPFTFSTHLARNLTIKKKWSDGRYLENGIFVNGKNYKVVRIKDRDICNDV